MRKGNIDRRQMTRGLVAGVAAASILPIRFSSALAQQAETAPPPPRVWKDLADLTQHAQELGLSVPRMSFSASAAEETYNETMPAVIDFMDSVEHSAQDARQVSSAEVDAILDRASELLRQARQAECPNEVSEEEAMQAAPVAAPAFETVADEYRKLFSTCVIKEDKRNEVARYVATITDPGRRKMYDQVFEETCVPWYFVAVTHGMEASFDTRSHLHNGDSLKNKTVQVPKGRPNPWNPPSDWVSSAVDAMKVDKFTEKSDWDLAKLLYRWEAYNGWRSRLLHNINTPYLWSYSNHYTKGKFVADGVWSGTAVSKQCGAAVMLKALVETGAVAPPA